MSGDAVSSGSDRESAQDLCCRTEALVRITVVEACDSASVGAGARRAAGRGVLPEGDRPTALTGKRLSRFAAERCAAGSAWRTMPAAAGNATPDSTCEPVEWRRLRTRQDSQRATFAGAFLAYADFVHGI